MVDFKELDVWKETKKLAVYIYNITLNFPKSEQFGLTNQIRRAAISIPSNVAEGTGRKTDKDTLHFLYISRGSLFELETQLDIAQELGFLSESEYTEILMPQTVKCRQLLNGYIRYFER
jgi:four helix bundle protein